MRQIRVQRKPQQLVLDALFVALLLHFFVTGSLVPSPIVELFRDQPQIVASTEPAHLPGSDTDMPLREEGEPLPETYMPPFSPIRANL
jgi:hypothetical protein